MRESQINMTFSYKLEKYCFRFLFIKKKTRVLLTDYIIRIPFSFLLLLKNGNSNYLQSMLLV